MSSHVRWLLRAILWCLALAVFVWAISRVSLQEVWGVVKELDLFAGAVLLLVNAVALVVFGLRWHFILRGLKSPIGVLPAAMYRLFGFGFAYFTPGPQIGGEPAQVLLVEKRHGVPRDVAIASVGLDRLFDVVINLILVTLALVVGKINGVLGVVMFVVLLIIYLLSLALGFTPITLIWANDIVRSSEVLAGRFCRECPRYLVLSVIVSFLSVSLMLGEYWLCVFFLGYSLSFEQVMLGFVAARASYMFFVPGALGVLEAGQVLAARSMGFSSAVGFGVSMIIRFRDVLIATVGLWWGMHVLIPLRKFQPMSSTVPTSNDYRRHRKL